MRESINPDRKRELGSFYTKGNPFLHLPFRQWMNRIPEGSKFLEPFAGNGSICRLMDEAGYNVDWTKFDIDETLNNVVHSDTLKSFPRGYEVVLTNPPYLSYHFAKRKRLPVDKEFFAGFPSLYMKAIALSLQNAKYVGMIIPESFTTSGEFKERLEVVISLPYQMFDDTDMPTCLALWGPEVIADSFAIWRGDEFLGFYEELAESIVPTACAHRIQFNVLNGQIGLRAIDDTFASSIKFCNSSDIDARKIKHSARLVSRIKIINLNDVDQVIEVANQILTEWRENTEDVLLTAFKGFRKDGRFRRRLDFSNARSILSNAICKVEGHAHSNLAAPTLF